MITSAEGTVTFEFETLAIKDEDGTVNYATGTANVSYEAAYSEEDEEFSYTWTIDSLSDVETYNDDEEVVIEEIDEDDEDHQKVVEAIKEALRLYRGDDIESEISFDFL